MLDNDKLVPDVEKLLRPQDAVVINENEDHKKFLERNKDKEHPFDYRKQALRFSHKVWALKMACEFWKANAGKCRYLIWMDADVIVTRNVTADEIAKCLPKEGDAVSYLGRKDWPHSECGWMAFDLQNGGDVIIDEVYRRYVSDEIFKEEEWHDSWIFDQVIKIQDAKVTNLTEGKPGMEIWPHSPMAAWSRHYKGPLAKKELTTVQPSTQPVAQIPQGGRGIKIQTKNSIPHEQIRMQILENQTQIKNWIGPCKKTDEELVIVSAGPLLVAEDLLDEVQAGRKIVAVKHALEPLKAAGIKPWAVVLLDPRPHLYKFVENPDTDVVWFVASQVHPPVVKKLLDSGCNVWGYHAAVGAEETAYTDKQFGAVISGGSATSTRSLFMFERMGFHNFRLYGYDLCHFDKPQMHELDDHNQPKYFDFNITAGGPAYLAKRSFWTRAELIAQFEEINQIIQLKSDWNIRAFGQGIVPFVYRAKEVNDLRMKEKMYKLGGEFSSYQQMLWQNKKK
jgi:hypothetical protein